MSIHKENSSRKFCYGVLLLLCILTTNSDAIAQVDKDIYEIQTLAFKTKNKVYLRWFFKSAKQWYDANQQGYIIERAEGNSTDFIKLTANPVKPISQEETKKIPENNEVYKTMGFVYHQPDFSKPEAEEGIYMMYVLQSSYSKENALSSGSMFIDSTIVSGKKYTYRVSVANVESKKQKITTVSIQDENKLPAAPTLMVNFGNRIAKLNWDVKPIMNEYFAIILEKSDDNINFNALTPQPLLTNIQDANTKDTNTTKKIMQYTDPGLENDQLYYYRIKGINLFGIESEPSVVISGSCSANLQGAPTIISVDTLQNKFILAWVMPDSTKQLVDKYEILVSKNNLDSSYRKILEFPAKNDLRAIFDFKPDASNYFVVKAIGKKADQIMESAPYLYQLKDSIPPAVPKGLTGTVDNKGVVTLKWKTNTEPDFLGYRVFRSFNNSKNYAVLNGTPFAATGFKDTLSLNQLNSNVYYRIAALDNRFNESSQSDSIHLNRPDTIPPAPTGIKKITVIENKSIEINWNKSFSSDVKNYLLFRKEGTDSSSTWKQLAELKNTDTSYTDQNIQPSTDYVYKIQAVDFGNLKSSFSAPFTAKVAKTDTKNKAINNLNAYVSHDKQYIELNWGVSKIENVSQYLIYRTINNNEQTVSLIATLPADKKIFDDNDVKLNSIYTYYIKAIYKAGGYSNLEKIEVTY